MTYDKHFFTPLSYGSAKRKILRHRLNFKKIVIKRKELYLMPYSIHTPAQNYGYVITDL